MHTQTDMHIHTNTPWFRGQKFGSSGRAHGLHAWGPIFHPRPLAPAALNGSLGVVGTP